MDLFLNTTVSALVRQYNLPLDSKHHGKDWYICTKTSIVNKELLATEPPVEITRAPRSIDKKKFWKTAEWKSFLLYYGLPVSNGILKRKYWNHVFFLLLVFAMHILFEDIINVSQISAGFRKFIRTCLCLFQCPDSFDNCHDL